MPAREPTNIVIGFAPIDFILLHTQRGFTKNASVGHRWHRCLRLAAGVRSAGKAGYADEKKGEYGRYTTARKYRNHLSLQILGKHRLLIQTADAPRAEKLRKGVVFAVG